MIPLQKLLRADYFAIATVCQFLRRAGADIPGIPVLREGNILELAAKKLNVVEACSGIRSLMALTFLSLFYGFFFDRKPWMSGFLLLATVPIAILANASRVALTGILTEVNPELPTVLPSAGGLGHLRVAASCCLLPTNNQPRLPPPGA